MTLGYLATNRPLNFEYISKNLAKIYPIEETLQVLNFKEKDRFGNLKRSWGPLEVVAGPWVGCWMLMFSANWSNYNTIPIPYETKIPDHVEPIVILSIIYNAWESWFNSLDMPEDLRLGKEFAARNWNEQLKELLNRPTLHVDREFFRFCIAYLDKKFDWSVEDFDINFSYASKQLKLKVENIEVCCPAIGNFDGNLTFPSYRKFCRNLPKRFTSDTILIEIINKEKVIIGSRFLPLEMMAKWTENNPAE